MLVQFNENCHNKFPKKTSYPWDSVVHYNKLPKTADCAGTNETAPYNELPKKAHTTAPQTTHAVRSGTSAAGTA